MTAMIMETPSVVRGTLMSVGSPLNGSFCSVIDAICPRCKHISEQSVNLPEELYSKLDDLLGKKVLILRGFSGDYSVKEVPA